MRVLASRAVTRGIRNARLRAAATNVTATVRARATLSVSVVLLIIGTLYFACGTDGWKRTVAEPETDAAY